MPIPAKVSDSFRRINPQIYAKYPTTESDGANAIMEQATQHDVAPKAQVKKRDRRKFLVRVTSFRYRLLDEDNICEKYHVDLCRYAGCISGDSPAQTRIVTTQKKISKEEAQYTLIEIETE